MYSFIFPEGGWNQLLTGAVSIHLVPGNHTGVLNTPNVQILAQFIEGELIKCYQ
jgi:thioesterase domain-containing protein